MMRVLFYFVAATVFACFLVSSAQAEDCAKMEKRESWSLGKEVPLDCATVFRAILPPLKEIPDLKALSKLSPVEAESILGPPYYKYTHNNELVVLFKRSAPVIIRYDEDKKMPVTIIFDVSGNFNINEIPSSLLNLGPAPPPFTGPVGPFWNDLGGFAQVEIHNPDYKYEGEFIYTVILNINKRTILFEQAEKIKDAQKKAAK